MICSSCGSQMQTVKKGNIDIEECASCGSIWFDSDELRRAKDATHPDLNWMDFDIWKNDVQFRVMSKSRLCPKDRIEMATIQYEGTPIDVDYCGRCQGIWLDKGEFEKVIDELTRDIYSKNSGEYWRATLQEAKEIITGREGMLSEWNDFMTVLELMQYRIIVQNPAVVQAAIAVQKYNPFRL